MSNLEAKNEVGKKDSLSLAKQVINSQTFRSSIMHMGATQNINNDTLGKFVIYYIGCDDKIYFKCIDKMDVGRDKYNEEILRFIYITLPALGKMLSTEIYADLVKYIHSVMEDFCNGIEEFAPFDLINGISEVNK